MARYESEEEGLWGLIGMFFAGFLSWHTWHSIGWLIIHCFFSWFYVIYWLIFIWDKKS